MHVALVITDAPWYESIGYARAWVSALEAEGCSVERLAALPADWSVSGPGAARYDLAVAHVLVEEVETFAPTFQVAAVLEATGVPLVNPVSALLASSDKLVTHAVWAAAGLPQPATWDLADLDRTAAAWPCPGRPMVLKPSLGDGARHIELVRDLDEARTTAESWRAWTDRDGKPRGAAVLQEWIADPQCVRLFATPDDVSLAYGKARDTGALITNGKYADIFEPAADLAGLARRMVATLGGGLMGVDVLVAADGRMLALEANAPFGFEVGDPEQGRWVAQAALRVARRRSSAA